MDARSSGIADSRCVVIGGAGFLGSHLTNYLVSFKKCQVMVIDNLVAGRREFVHDEATFIHHDITGSEVYLWKLLKEFGAEYVFNYAAYPYVPDSFAHPLRVCDVNFFGAMKVINAAQEAGVKAILQVSSAEVYGEGGASAEGDTVEKKVNELGLVLPHSSYGASKAAIDYWCQCRWREAKTPVVVLRQFNCVGERETHPYVVPEIISQLDKQADFVGWTRSTPTVYLGNNSSRDFLYAGDAVRIAVKLLERGQFGEVYNLGSEAAISIYDLARRVGAVMGFIAGVKVEVDEARKRPWEIWHLRSDNAKINRTIDQPANLTPLSEALARTLSWYRSNKRKWPWE